MYYKRTLLIQSVENQESSRCQSLDPIFSSFVFFSLRLRSTFPDLDFDADLVREIPHLSIFCEKAFTQTGETLWNKPEEEMRQNIWRCEINIWAVTRCKPARFGGTKRVNLFLDQKGSYFLPKCHIFWFKFSMSGSRSKICQNIKKKNIYQNIKKIWQSIPVIRQKCPTNILAHTWESFSYYHHIIFRKRIRHSLQSFHIIQISGGNPSLLHMVGHLCRIWYHGPGWS